MPINENGEFKIPKAVKSISGTAVFKGNEDNIKKLVIHGEVSKIVAKYLYLLKNLEEIEVADDNPQYSSVNGGLYNKNKNMLVRLPRASKVSEISVDCQLAPFALSGCRNLQKVNIGAGKWSIPKSAFSGCENLKYVNFDKDVSLMTIDSEAFAGCTGLKELVLPKKTDYIADGALRGCRLDTLVLPDRLFEKKDEIVNILGINSPEEAEEMSIKKASEYYTEEERNSTSNITDKPSSDSENVSKMVSNPDENALPEKPVSSSANNRIQVEIPEIDDISKTEKRLAEKNAENHDVKIVDNLLNMHTVVNNSYANNMGIAALMKMIDFGMPLEPAQNYSIKDFQIALLKKENENALLKKDNELLKKDKEMAELKERIASMGKDKEIAELKIALMERDKEIASLLREGKERIENENAKLKKENEEAAKEIAALKNTEAQLRDNIKSLNSSGKLMSFNSARYEGIIKDHPEIHWNAYKDVKTSVQFHLNEANTFIEAGKKYYLVSGLPMRMAIEACLSEICNLYDIPIEKKELLTDLFKKTKHLFNKDTAKGLKRAIERCSSPCHAKRVPKRPDDFLFTKKEAREHYRFLQEFYEKDFESICLKKLPDLSSLSKSTAYSSEIFYSNLKNQNTEQMAGDNVFKEKTDLIELEKESNKETKRKIDDDIDRSTFGSDSKSGSSTLVTDKCENKQQGNEPKK